MGAVYVPPCAPLGPYGAILLVHQHTHTCTCMCVCSQQHRDCHLQIQSTDLLLKIQAVTFIRRPQPKPSSLQTKGHVCGSADISTSLSLTHSLQRQRLCLVTHRDSVSGSAAWCEPVLPQAVVGEAVFFHCSFKCSLCHYAHRNKHKHTYIMYNIYLLYWYKYINSINKAQPCHSCERGTFQWRRQVGGPGQLGASLRSICVWCKITRRRWVVRIVTPWVVREEAEQKQGSEVSSTQKNDQDYSLFNRKKATLQHYYTGGNSLSKKTTNKYYSMWHTA